MLQIRTPENFGQSSGFVEDAFVAVFVSGDDRRWRHVRVLDPGRELDARVLLDRLDLAPLLGLIERDRAPADPALRCQLAYDGSEIGMRAHDLLRHLPLDEQVV